MKPLLNTRMQPVKQYGHHITNQHKVTGHRQIIRQGLTYKVPSPFQKKVQTLSSMIWSRALHGNL